MLGFPGGSDSEESTCNAGELGLIPGLGRYPGGRHGIMLPYWLPGKESTCDVGDVSSIPGLGRFPRREQLPTLVFWPGEFHRLYSPGGHKE